MAQAYYNENDDYAAQWLENLIRENLIAPGVVDRRSIVDVSPSDLAGFVQCHFFAGIGVWSYALRKRGWPDDREIWTGSCPCQPFSAAGKRGGFADKRHLWPIWFQLIRARKPVTVLGEQVASKDGLAWFDPVQSDLESENYTAGAVDLCAAGVGAPHIRQRLWFMAHANGRNASTAWLQRSGQHGLGSQDGSALPLVDSESERRGRGTHEQDEGRRERTSSNRSASDHGLADADEGRCDSRQRCECVPARESVAGGDDAISLVADSLFSGRTEGRTIAGNGPLARCGAIGELGDADESRSQGRRIGRNCAVEFSLGASGLVDTHTHTPGPCNGFWHDAEFIACTDGKARPIESGTSPLVAGASFKLGSGSANAGKSRTGMLRGYGNAINAEAAAEFIGAAMSAIDDLNGTTVLK